MRLLVQRALRGEVEVDDPDGTTRLTGRIGKGLVVFAGFGVQDGDDLPQTRLWTAMLDKLLGLRIFPDDEGRFNRALDDVQGGLLLVSQFTLYADCRRGRRPSFDGSLPPVPAEALYNRLVDDLRARLGERLQCGEFGAAMRVGIINWGPVTIMLDSKEF